MRPALLCLKSMKDAAFAEGERSLDHTLCARIELDLGHLTLHLAIGDGEG
jgi:hypothetical protein